MQGLVQRVNVHPVRSLSLRDERKEHVGAELAFMSALQDGALALSLQVLAMSCSDCVYHSCRYALMPVPTGEISLQPRTVLDSRQIPLTKGRM